LCVKQFQPAAPVSSAITQKGNLLKESITAIRDARNKAQLKPKEEIALHIQAAAESDYQSITGILAKQVNAKSIAFTTDAVAKTLAVVAGKDKFYIESEQAVNTGNQKEELMKELEYLRGFLVSVEKKLGNERFVQNAKPEVVELEQKKKSDALAKVKVIEDSLASL
jgi:valyl-tRNA synthetase